MRLVAPLCVADEVGALVEAGADELYCGIVEEWWRRRYGDHDSANRRQGAANLTTRAELAETVTRANESHIPVYLAVNVRYTEPQLDYLTDLCLDFERMGGTGVIVSDIGLLGRLQNQTNLRRCLSLLAVAENIPTIAAYRLLGIDRVVLPRFITPTEAKLLLQPFGDLEAEVMAFFDKCPFVDGYCRHYHGVARADWQAEPSGLPPEGEPDDQAGVVAGEPNHRPPVGALNGQQLEPESDRRLPEPLYTFDTTFRTHACLGRQQRYLQTHPCAACHLSLYEAADVGYAKIGGRGRPLADRIQALRFLRQASTLTDDVERNDLYQQTFGQPCQCYYGEATQPRDAVEPRQTVASDDRYWLDYGDAAPSSYRDVMSPQGDVAPSTSGETLSSSQTAFRRLIVGSETDSAALGKLLSAWEWIRSLPIPLTVVIPPLPQNRLADLLALVELLYSGCGPDTHLCVNDLGSFRCVLDFAGTKRLVSSDQSHEHTEMPFTVTVGSLLVRADDPTIAAHFLNPSENPSRIVVGPGGEPRLLSYAPPSPELVRHWRSPSALEPTARATLAELLDGQPIIYEFA